MSWKKKFGSKIKGRKKHQRRPVNKSKCYGWNFVDYCDCEIKKIKNWGAKGLNSVWLWQVTADSGEKARIQSKQKQTTVTALWIWITTYAKSNRLQLDRTNSGGLWFCEDGNLPPPPPCRRLAWSSTGSTRSSCGCSSRRRMPTLARAASGTNRCRSFHARRITKKAQVSEREKVFMAFGREYVLGLSRLWITLKLGWLFFHLRRRFGAFMGLFSGLPK